MTEQMLQQSVSAASMIDENISRQYNLSMKSLLLSAFAFLFIIRPSYAQEFPLFITEHGHILTEVTLNDTLKANFVLDTAAGITVLSAKTFEKVKDIAEETGYFTGFRHDGDRITAPIYQIPSISISDITQRNVSIGVYPPLDDYGIDGLISLTFFEEKPFSIDFRNKTLSLMNSQELSQLAENSTVLPISLQKKAGVSLDIFIPICLNNRVEVLAEFDTGSGYGSFLINPYYIKKLGLDESEAETRSYTTPISQTKLTDTIYSLDSIGICSGENTPQQTDAAVTFRENLIYEALIGSALFKDRKITIDIPGQRFFIHN